VTASRIGIISLGCAKNLVDTEVMLGHLDRAGHHFVSDPAEADTILVNTCSFIAAAREESIRTILETAELKKTGRLKRLVVAGCMVQRYAEELRRELPEVDAFIGLDELHKVVEATGAPSSAGGESVEQPADWNASRYLYDETTPRRLATPEWTAYLKIAEGCDHTCAFCAIPSFRGRFRSRDPEDVVAEARRLAAGGVREINLIAQDSSQYGKDRGGGEGLPELLVALDAVPALRWIRVHYLYPNSITDRLIETMARTPRVVKYVDLPLQHADAATLSRMRRGGSAESHLKLLGRIRRAMPEVTLRSTFIAGFPGETDREFENLVEFVGNARLRHLGVFTYSHEDGTHAADLADDVPEEVKRERHDRLMACQQEIVLEENASWIGREVEVLVEGAHAETDHLLVGRMSAQAPDVDGQILINDGGASPGEFVRVELTEVAGYDLVGRIVGPA
jgi:ribosomal protein S12 methylthiotransferase